MEFHEFAKIVNQQFERVTDYQDVYRVDVSREKLWETYLGSFPEGSNPIYKERTEHDCNTCKNFIRDVGNVVAIVDGEVKTIWDTKIGGPYGVVSSALRELVSSAKIADLFSHPLQKIGADKTLQELENGEIKTWRHFHCVIPQKFVHENHTLLNDVRTSVGVFERGANEISIAACDLVLDLISQGSLYKGAEFESSIKEFRKLKLEYDAISDPLRKNHYVWSNIKRHGSRIKNTVIGTLLMDISSGKDLEEAVKSYEFKTAPTNYKRPTALITKGMIEQATKTVKELGLEPALHRRFAIAEDLSVNNVLFVDRSTASVMKDSVMDELLSTAKSGKQDFSKVTEIHIDDFIESVLPQVEEMEVFFAGNQQNNLMSLLAPTDLEAPNILRWNNNFSWSYNGNVTDSITEKVKSAGGNVSGFLRASLAWSNFDDLDLHVIEPNGNRIFYRDRKGFTGGQLDVDMNAGSGTTREPVENIYWQDRKRMVDGVYTVHVHQFEKRESSDVGFTVELDIDGTTKQLTYPKAVRSDQFIEVARLHWKMNRVEKVEINKELSETGISKTIWGIDTENFHKVRLLTTSPNHWDGQAIGHKHYFFILDKCLNDMPARGFYNEFLLPELEKHRKVFEVLGDKTKCELTDNHLSGLGFSASKRDSVICRVSGKFNRTLKITF